MRLSPLPVILVMLAAPALAQNVPQPRFEPAKPPAADAPVWTAQAKGSLLVTSGNSQTQNGVLGLVLARQWVGQRLAFDGQITYGRSRVVVPVFAPDDPVTIVALVRRRETTTNQWNTRGRYDRFFTTSNAAYLLGQVGADRIAGKALVGGGQVGYSRELVKSTRHATVAELGYDLSYESYTSQPGKVLEAVQIHSARFALAEAFTISPETALSANLEALFNLNREDAIDVRDPSRRTVAPLRDTRLGARAALTTNLWKKLSFSFGVTVRYDQNPAPRPVPGSAKGAAYSADYLPFADKIDTLTEATLVFNFI